MFSKKLQNIKWQQMAADNLIVNQTAVIISFCHWQIK